MLSLDSEEKHTPRAAFRFDFTKGGFVRDL